MKTLHGALVIDEDDTMLEVAVLIMTVLQKLCTYKQYNHPTQILHEREFDFMMVSQAATIHRLVTHYARSEKPLPLIIHLVDPREMAEIDYATEFPDVHIQAIPQDSLGEGFGTLKFEGVQKAILTLRTAAKAGDSAL